jgi:hypothetical protein
MSDHVFMIESGMEYSENGHAQPYAKTLLGAGVPCNRRAGINREQIGMSPRTAAGTPNTEHRLEAAR